MCSFLSRDAEDFLLDLEDSEENFIVSGGRNFIQDSSNMKKIEDLNISPSKDSSDFHIDEIDISSIVKYPSKFVIKGEFLKEPTEFNICSCGCSEYRKGGKRVRQLIDIPLEGVKTQIILTLTIWRCKQCDTKLEWLPLSILPKRRLTKRAVDYIKSGVDIGKTNEEIGDFFGVGESTIRFTKKQKEAA